MNRQLIPSIVLLFGLTLDTFPAVVAPPTVFVRVEDGDNVYPRQEETADAT